MKSRVKVRAEKINIFRGKKTSKDSKPQEQYNNIKTWVSYLLFSGRNILTVIEVIREVFSGPCLNPKLAS